MGPIALAAMLVGCGNNHDFYNPEMPPTSAPASVQPPTISAAGPSPLTQTIAVSFDPSELIFSASVNKLYVSAVSEDSVFVVSLSAPTQPIKRLEAAIGETAIGVFTPMLVVNEKLRRGYALTRAGSIKVFSTDSDTLVSTSRAPSCKVDLLAINQATGMVYAGGLSDKGACLVQFDSDGRIVREAMLSDPGVKNMRVQHLAVDPATGDVLYTSTPGVGLSSSMSAVGGLDQMLTQKWRTPIGGHGGVPGLGFEPKTNTVYVSVDTSPINSPARFTVLDGGTGRQRGEFDGPGSGAGAASGQFAATGDGRLFFAAQDSHDVYVLSDGTSTFTKFASLDYFGASSLSLTVDPAGRRLFVAPQFDARKIFVYQY